MSKSFGRLCGFYREAAGFTQEQAAELLHVSVRTVGAYENGEYMPHDDTVDMMVVTYNAPELGYHYLSRVLRTGRRLLPETCAGGAAATATQFRRSIRQVSSAADALDDICADDTITANEKKPLAKCLGKIRELAAACMNVSLLERWLGQKEKAALIGGQHGITEKMI